MMILWINYIHVYNLRWAILLLSQTKGILIYFNYPSNYLPNWLVYESYTCLQVYTMYQLYPMWVVIATYLTW